MAWKMVDQREQRVRFVVRASEPEGNLSALCREFGISRPTGYVWLKRWQAEKTAGLEEKSRRPQNSPGKTSAAVEQQIVELRRQRPDWGARKLRPLLAERGIELPVITLHRALLRHGLVRAEDRHEAAVQRFQRAAPNELWQMDFKGGSKHGSLVGPLSVLDDHSRYLLLLRHLGSTQMSGVQTSLTETFRAFGLPEAMLMDHGTPWWNAASPWGLTELSIWIMRLGIRLTLSGIGHPQTQGKVERMHGALERAVRKRQANLEDQSWLDGFREEYNHVRPHEALQMATPASVWKPSLRAFPEVLPEWQYPDHALCLRLGGDGQLSWRGRRWEISNALRRQVVGIEQVGDRAVVYFCRTPMRELDLQAGTASPLLGAPIRSL